MFWDNVAGVYDVFVKVVNAKTHKRLKEIVAGQIGCGDTVLECACGTGMLSGVIAPKCKELTATDFSPKMLKKAKKNCAGFGNITFAQADITALPFPDNSFDKAVAGNVIHLLDNPLTALKELDRVVKPGGALIIPTYMNRDEKGDTGAFASALQGLCRELCLQHVLIMRVVVAENVVDHVFFRDVIGAHNDEVLNVVATQQFSGGTVCDPAEHFAQLLQRYNVGIIPIDLIKAFFCNTVIRNGFTAFSCSDGSPPCGQGRRA